ncbi:hypothetical protein MRB53_017425 [Persea americana]|uniref:Uncharacterized protein n=1 Tax=Persea americana TaxID=3435 RepID=A0ACC2M5W6_PERAE|nr:hypothetical protein MRB53_017425 [Persea americana]
MSGQEELLRPQEQMMVKNAEEKEREGAASAGSGQLQSLPMESSPYVKYSDLEDYKQQGYGTGGHMEPVETGKGGGSTDAPTLSGGAEGAAKKKLDVDEEFQPKPPYVALVIGVTPVRGPHLPPDRHQALHRTLRILLQDPTPRPAFPRGPPPPAHPQLLVRPRGSKTSSAKRPPKGRV